MLYKTLRIAVPLFLACLASAYQDSQAPILTKLNIVIVKEGPIARGLQRTQRETIVEVQDENHKPVGGAVIVFTLANEGACVFSDGSKLAMLTADPAGRATMPSLKAGSGRCAVKIRGMNDGHEGNNTAEVDSSAPPSPGQLHRSFWKRPPTVIGAGVLITAVTLFVTQPWDNGTTGLTISFAPNGPIVYKPR